MATKLNVQLYTSAPKWIDISQTILASKEKIWEALTNYHAMTQWFPMIKSVKITHKGNITDKGVGCKRECKFGNELFKEEIVHFDEPNLYAFKIADNKLFKNHLAIFSIEQKNNQNLFRFQSYFNPKGNFLKKYAMTRFMMPFLADKALKNFAKKIEQL